MTTTRICPECGQEFTAAPKKGKPRTFCTDAHKQAHANRRASRGKSLVAMAQAWCRLRSAKKGSENYDLANYFFREVQSMVDEWNAEDKAAERMDPVEYAKLVIDFQRVNPDYNGGRTFDALRWMDRMERR